MERPADPKHPKPLHIGWRYAIAAALGVATLWGLFELVKLVFMPWAIDRHELRNGPLFDRLSEAGLIAAIVGAPGVMWFVARLIARMKRAQRWMLIAPVVLLGHAVLIGGGLAAAIFFGMTHDEGGAPSGGDYVEAALAIIVPIIVGGPMALIVWIVTLVRTSRETPTSG
jgi:hypothetical protein